MLHKTFTIFIIVILYSCDNKKNQVHQNKAHECSYNIETITHWEDEKNKQSRIPFIVLKIDTVNYIGSSVRYTEKGKLFEKIIILDNKKAVKLDYESDTIASSIICNYKIRKDHPTQNAYSIVIW